MAVTASSLHPVDFVRSEKEEAGIEKSSRNASDARRSDPSSEYKSVIGV